MNYYVGLILIIISEITNFVCLNIRIEYPEDETKNIL